MFLNFEALEFKVYPESYFRRFHMTEERMGLKG